VRDGDFRVRGKEISRVEGLSDAVFGFAITLLVVSLEVPHTSTELLHAMRGFGAFAVTFGILFSIWRTQFTFFRRYGIEDNVTVGLTAVLLFVVLFFIYPLKFIMGFLVDLVTNSMDPATARALFPKADRPPLQIAFGLGFSAVFGVFALMYRHAYQLRDRLKLDALELLDTREAIRATSTASALGLAIALSYLVGMIAPTIRVAAEWVGTGCVFLIAAVQIRARLSHKTRRESARGIGREAL
jgi:uncharacterized membrane protein